MTGKPARLTMREREYRAALAKLEAAKIAVLLWADSVSADVERRLGVDSGDPRRYDEPEYGQALDIVGHVKQAVAMLRAARLPGGLGGDGLAHWLDGVRCPDCRKLNPSWLAYSPQDGPAVECEHCGAVVLVPGPDAGRESA